MSTLEDIRKKHPNVNLFNTIQRFKADVQTEGELQWAPLFFDLDYKDDVEIALLDARVLVNYFSQMDIGKENIRIFFSGSKGFHITVEPELFGIKPHAELTYIIKSACNYVATALSLKSFDQRVYSIRRMWRMPDSKHLKTGLYCVELDHSELNQSLEHIRTLAKEPRGPIYLDDEYEQLDVNPICQAWFDPFVKQYETQKELQNLRPRNVITVHAGENPVCIEDLLANSIRKVGTRNQGEMALASYFKDTGVDEATTLNVVKDWANKIPQGMTSKTDKRQLEADVKGVVKLIYDNDNPDKYRFACHFIRALGSGTDLPIKCAFDKCKFVKQEDQEPEKTLDLKLQEASRAVYIGKKFKTEVMVAGKDDVPYGIPVKCRISCKPDLNREGGVCQSCSIAVFGGVYDFEFKARDPHILGLLDVSEAHQKGFLRKRCGIPERCMRHKIEILEYTNIVEIMAIPRIDFRPDTINEDEQYVVRKGYFVGHDIEANKEYNITAFTFPDPKSQHLVHIIEEAQKISDDIVEFAPSREVLESMRIFQIRQ
jgi:hypothetical protein